LPILIWPCLLVYSAHIKNAPAFALSPLSLPASIPPAPPASMYFFSLKNRTQGKVLTRSTTCAAQKNRKLPVINGGSARLSFTERVAICQQKSHFDAHASTHALFEKLRYASGWLSHYYIGARVLLGWTRPLPPAPPPLSQFLFSILFFRETRERLCPLPRPA
jgi:hypothetical protein